MHVYYSEEGGRERGDVGTFSPPPSFHRGGKEAAAVVSKACQLNYKSDLLCCPPPL